MDVQTYFRKAFSVEAVQVTAENLDEVTRWCSGGLSGGKDDRYIKVKVLKPTTIRQTKAYIGDWLLKSNRGFKVYTDKAFNNNFMKDEDGKINQFWEDAIDKTHSNVFENVVISDGADFIVSEKDAISGKR